MTPEVAALKIEHLEAMGETDPVRNARRMSGVQYVYLLDQKPIAAAGLALIGGRHFLAWCLMTPELRSSKILMRKLMREIKTRYPIIRDLIHAEKIEAVTADLPAVRRWLEAVSGLKPQPVVAYGWTRGQDG